MVGGDTDGVVLNSGGGVGTEEDSDLFSGTVLQSDWYSCGEQGYGNRTGSVWRRGVDTGGHRRTGSPREVNRGSR